ncbi:hypothetical protein HAX54_029040, partial [Datura stramonium]|nr:hypothetical protein [Datura stramonium]
MLVCTLIFLLGSSLEITDKLTPPSTISDINQFLLNNHFFVGDCFSNKPPFNEASAKFDNHDNVDYVSCFVPHNEIIQYK